MRNTPPLNHRRQQSLAARKQSGRILSWTKQRTETDGRQSSLIALIELEDGSRVIGNIVHTDQVQIGQTVLPRLQCVQVAANGLREYAMCYEPAAIVSQTTRFPGYIVALTGPSGVGKSTINKLLSTVLTDQLEPVPIITTRAEKKGDDKEYRYVSAAEFRRLQQQGDIVAATDIPAQDEKRWYGYLAADIETIWQSGRIPSVVTEMHLLQGLSQHYGRRSILSFGLLPPGRSKRARLSALLHRLRQRGRDTEQSIQDRITNAEKDLSFFTNRADLFDHMIVNEHLDGVVETLSSVIKKHVPKAG